MPPGRRSSHASASWPRAQSAFEVALELLTGNNGWGIAHALYGFGSLARARRDNAGALRHFRSALELFRQIGARTEMARCLAGIGWVALASLDLPTAAASLGESLELSMAAGQRLGIARGLEACAALAVVRGDDAAAARLEGAANVLRDVVGQVRSAAAQARLDSLLAAAHHRLGSDATASLIGEGRRLSTSKAVSYALASAAAAPDRAADDANGTPAGRATGGRPIGSDRQGAADRSAHRPRTVQSGDRRGARHQPGDGGPARGQHPGQARAELACPGRRVDRRSAIAALNQPTAATAGLHSLPTWRCT